MRLHHLSFALALAPLALAACTEAPTDAPPVVDSGAYHHFAQSTWTFGATPQEVWDLGFDLDDVPDDGGDNNMGMLIAAVAQVGALDVISPSAGEMAAGRLVLLHSLRADRLDDDDSVTWRLFQGLPADAPAFDGTDTFEVTSDAGLLSGAIRGGVLTAAGDGMVTVRVAFFPDQPPIALPLALAQVELDVASGVGRIGGAIPGAVLDDQLLPAFGAQAALHIARNPDAPQFATALRYLDSNDDGVVQPSEIVENANQLLTRDIDLDHDGQRRPDAVSFAAGFHLAPAAFVGIGE